MVNQPENQSQPATPELIAQPVRQKFCPKCGTLNAPDAKFCYKCGAPLIDTAAPGKKICAGCSTANEAAFQYCLKCGLKLSEATVNGVPRHYAGFWIRLGAYLIDSIILGIVINIITSPLYLLLLGKTTSQMLEELPSFSNGNPDPALFFDWYWKFMGAVFIISLIGMAFNSAYFTIGVGKWGTTIGKAACGLKVVRTDGSRVSYWRAFARHLAQIINGFTLGLSYLVIAFNGKKQGIHDMMCDTIVVKKQ